MNFIGAVESAMAGEKVRRRSYPRDVRVEIIGTPNKYLLMGDSTGNGLWHYSPQTDDILAEDWEVLNDERSI